jgi:endoribonuclease Dicer
VNEGCNVESVQTVFDKMFKPFYIRHVRLQTLLPHPSSTLFELLQAEHCHAHGIKKEVDGQNVRCNGKPSRSVSYFLCLQGAHIVVVHEAVLASGTDRASNMATRKAASAALDALAVDPEFMSRVCDCRAKQAGKKALNKMQLGYEDDADALAVENALTTRDGD